MSELSRRSALQAVGFGAAAVGAGAALAACSRAKESAPTLDDIQLGNTTIDQAISSNKMTVDGQRESFNEFIGLLDKFPFWFNIVTP